MGSLLNMYKLCNRVPVLVPVVRALYENMTSYEGWSDVHLPKGWLLSHWRVPMPPVPWQGQERHQEITRRRALLPLDLLADLAYGINLPTWDSFGHLEWEPQHRAGSSRTTSSSKALPRART